MVEVDASTMSTVTIKNTCQTAPFVSSATVTGKGFTVDEMVLSVNLSGGKTASVNISFTLLPQLVR